MAGNAYRGVAINNCVAEAGPVAASVLSHVLAGQPPEPLPA
ncbi:MAG: hypothetical protein Q7V01_15980 [Vicinamibacterales bacterium]|nr:hypothetical protein [Vicinamibacterales bacterium]